MKLFVVNVGVNKSDASKRRMKSPIFTDKTFEFIPIKESKKELKYCDDSSHYSSIKCFNNPKNNLAKYLPHEVHNYNAHNDPDLDNLTYGDVYSSRAGNLKRVSTGDIILFLARLYDYDLIGGKFLKSNSLYFISSFDVEENLEFVKNSAETVNRRLKKNAHYKKLIKGKKDIFRVIVGKKSSSYRFKKAIKITEETAALLFNAAYDRRRNLFISNEDRNPVKNKNGRNRKSENFPQITRSIQYFLNSKNKIEQESLKKLLKIIGTNSR